MDPIIAILVGVGLTLAVAGTLALVAWRHERSPARVPAVLLGLAITVLAFPVLVDLGSVTSLEPGEDAEGAGEHADDAVVSPEEVQRR